MWTTVQNVTDLDQKQPETVERIKAFNDAALSTRLRDAAHKLPGIIPISSFFLQDVAEDDKAAFKPVYADGENGAFLQYDSTPDAFDTYVNAQLLLPDSNEDGVQACVVKHAKGG